MTSATVGDMKPRLQSVAALGAAAHMFSNMGLLTFKFEVFFAKIKRFDDRHGLVSPRSKLTKSL